MQLEYKLRTEIEFWQDVIDTSDAEASEETLQRMNQAKSLAERKLELFLTENGALLN